jgi:hypothetical protein
LYLERHNALVFLPQAAQVMRYDEKDIIVTNLRSVLKKKELPLLFG